MRILYGVTGCGLGHTMRARALARHLLSRGHELKFAASGRAVEILRGHGFDVVAIDGMRMHYERGAVERASTVVGLLRQAPRAIVRNGKVALALDFEPDAIITDFDSFSHAVGKILKRPIISVDHQHVLDRFVHPRDVVRRSAAFTPACAFVSAKTARCDDYIVSSFFFPDEQPRNRTRTALVGPIVRPEIAAARVTRGDHVLVYQTTSGDPRVLSALASVHDVRFVVYGLGARRSDASNVELRAFDEAAFVADLASARAVISNGGFTALSEAVYLGKPALSIPVRRQPEQELNAAYVDALGIGMSAPIISGETIERFLSRLDEFRPLGDPRLRTGTADACAALDRALAHAARKEAA